MRHLEGGDYITPNLCLISETWETKCEPEEEVNLITFTVNETEYQAEEGMTWEEWINSEYNKNSIYKINTINGFIYHSGYGPNTRIVLIDGSITYEIFSSDAILSNGTYILQAYGDSGGS